MKNKQCKFFCKSIYIFSLTYEICHGNNMFCLRFAYFNDRSKYYVSLRPGLRLKRVESDWKYKPPARGVLTPLARVFVPLARMLERRSYGSLMSLHLIT